MNEEDKIYNSWNEQKKSIDKLTTGHFYREREVWWCNLGKNIGFEQDGRGDYYERPVIIIKAFSRFVCLVIPLTTSIKKNRYHLDSGTIEKKQSYAIISQIRLIDVKRLVNRICILDVSIFENTRKAVRELF